jgi:allantoate deiminase
MNKAIIHPIAARVAQRCDLLALRSDRSDCLARLFCSPAMKLAHQDLSKWMTDARLVPHLDALGNLIGKPVNEDPQRPVLLIGSHLDTVINAGRFDGMLGVLLGLGVVETVNQLGIELPFDIHVVAFSEEEGVRYRLPFIGSAGIAGIFDPADLDRVDDDGISMREALVNFGCQPDDHQSVSYGRRKVIGFMEAHLEQAVRLQETQQPVAAVSAIAGQTRASIFIEGVAGHAGTVPHDRRSDALAAAAKLILDIEQLGQTTQGLFATVGSITSGPNLSNVISNHTELSLDLRHAQNTVRSDALKTIELMIMELKKTRDVAGRITSQRHSPAVPMDDTLTKHLNSAIESTGGAGDARDTLVSGAGHDAMVIAGLAPASMLFVRCKDGVSHHPDEYVAPEDIAVALEVMVGAVKSLTASPAEN